MLFGKFPRGMGFERKTMNSLSEMLQYINLNNGTKNVYTTVYHFTNINPVTKKLDFSTAQIDKIFIDLDSDNCYDDMLLFHKFCSKEDLLHCIFFSGRGFHVYIFAEGNISNKKSSLINATNWLIENASDERKIVVDNHVVGDLARVTRVPNTYNIKRKRFCIPLAKQQLGLSFESIKKLAATQQVQANIIMGTKKLNLQQFDKEIQITNVEFGDAEGSADLSDFKKFNFKPCIYKMMKVHEMKHEIRYELIVYLRDYGFSQTDVLKLMQKVLSPKKFYHMTVQERNQTVKQVFQSVERYQFSCKKVKRMGFCNGEEECSNDLYY